VRVASFSLGEGESSRLLMVIHHLAVDGVSWRILLEDLQAGYEQAGEGREVRLAAKTTSYKRWAQELARYAESEELKRERDYWEKEAGRAVAAVPVDYEGGANTVESGETVSLRLDRDSTRRLLQEVARSYKAQINEVLLSALVRGYGRWSGQEAMRVEVEGHGREDVIEGVDVTRTVGWFTSIYPVVLEAHSGEAREETIKRVKETIRGIPNKGIGYGVLGMAEQWNGGKAEVLFNYLGQVDQAVGESKLFGVARERAGEVRSRQGERVHVLEVSAIVVGEQMQVSVSYSRNLHSRERAEGLARRYVQELEGMIEGSTKQAARAFVTSDFALAAIEQQQLDRVCADYPQMEDVYPLSHVQQGIVFHSVFNQESGVYVVQLCCTINKSINVSAFKQAWHQVVIRHEILRSAFVWESGNHPMQVVYGNTDLPWEELDWRGLPRQEQQKKLEDELQADRNRGFELSKAPLMRFILIRLGEDSYEFIWSHQHLLLDGWSTPIIAREVFAFYEAYDRGERLTLDEPRRYRDYIAWLQRQDMAGPADFWREMMSGFSRPTPLSVDRSPDHSPRQGGHNVQQRDLSAEATGALQSFARQNQLTISTLAQGAWALLLSVYSGEQDVCFGVTVSGRSAGLTGIESMVGLFINTLPSRVNVNGDQPLVSWLKRLQEQQVKMGEYEYAPLAKVQKWGGTPRGVALFESILAVENYPVDATLQEYGAGIGIESVRCLEQTNYPLNVSVYPGEELRLEVLYDSGRFDDAVIARMLGHLETLLDSIAGGSGKTLSQLRMLTSAESHQILVEWNGTEAAYSTGSSIHELFERQVRLAPDQPAVVSGGRSLTYREVNERANQVARYLQKSGVGPEVLVGLHFERSAKMLVAMLGILKAGGAYLPLDPSYPSERLALMVEDAGAAVLLTQQKLADRFRHGNIKLICLDADQDMIGRESVEDSASGVTPDNLAYVIYTSGSTGTPKGVLITHDALMSYTLAVKEEFGLRAGDRVLQFASISFDVAVEEIFPTWLSGAAVVIEGEAPGSSESLSRIIEKNSLTAFELPTAYWHEWVEELTQTGSSMPPCVRYVIVGGERALPEQLVKWQKLGVELIHVYGLTETAVTSSLYKLPASARREAASELPIGRAIASAKLYLLDDSMRPVPVGAPGEIYIGGGGLARGYHRRPHLTAERFLPDPFGARPGAMLYRTGDLARWLSDGNIEFIGRIDNQVKVRGFRIEPGEIEEALAEHSGVREALVLARESKPGYKRLVAYVVPKTASASGNGNHKNGHSNGSALKAGSAIAAAEILQKPTITGLRTHLEKRLPAYMVPSAFVLLDEWPLTPNGKVDRQALLPPDATRPDLDTAYVPPGNAVEERLAKIWADTIGIEQIGIHDNFFDVGGDSIISLQIVARANQAGLKLTPNQIFKHQTVAELASVVVEAGGSEGGQEPVVGAVPLTPIQEWFFEQEFDDPHHWNMALLLNVNGGLDPVALDKSVRHLQAHHDALRLRFNREGSGWHQFNAAVDDVTPALCINLSMLSESKHREAIEAAAADLQASLNLSHGPLIRVAAFDVGEDKPARLLMIIHHLVVDGVSWRILLEDLQAGYEQANAGHEVKLAAKTTSYKRWANELVRYAASEELKQEREYWEKEASRAVASVPVDYEGGANTVESGETVSVKLDKDSTRKLLQDVGRSYKTQINEVLLSALARGYGRWSGQEAMRVEVEGHGREDVIEGVDVTRTVGWFTSIYPAALSSNEGESVADSIKRTKERIRSIPNRGIGYGLLRYLDPETKKRWAAAENTRTEISFNYMGQLDNSLPASSLFTQAQESVGNSVSPRALRQHLLEVRGRVIGGELQMDWTASRNSHRRETIERLAGLFMEEMRTIISHSESPDTGGVTPSDFSRARISQRDLEKLMARIARQEEES
jgi:amino acid adenylation domain-containing protein/non-ribosomal peptide synthase protein (TIGR01720 family)